PSPPKNCRRSRIAATSVKPPLRRPTVLRCPTGSISRTSSSSRSPRSRCETVPVQKSRSSVAAAEFNPDRCAPSGMPIAVVGCDQWRRFMSKFFIGSLALGIAMLLAVSSSAQDRRNRQPHTGSEAVGFEVGAFVPDDDTFNSGLLVNGLFEYYVRPRVSLRTEFGLTDPGHTREPVDSLRQVPLRLDVN